MILGTHAERLAFDVSLIEEGKRWIETDTGYEYVKFESAWHTPPVGGGGPHTHPESDITNLVTDLAGKALSVHTHAESDVSNLVTDLAGKANVSHTHSESQVTNLVTDLAGKEPANANIQAHVTSAHAPANAQKNSDILQAEIEARLTGQITTHTHAAPAGMGYAINVQALTSSPVDAQTIYFGMLPKAPVTVAGTSKIYIRAAGTIKRAEIYVYSGTAGSNEAWSMYIRKNNTTDTLIATVSAATSERVFSNKTLNIAMADGDYFEIKAVNPTWATNPLTCIIGGYIYAE